MAPESRVSAISSAWPTAARMARSASSRSTMDPPFTPRPRQVLLSDVSGIHQRNHLKLRTALLQGDHKKDALGIERHVEIAPLSSLRHAVEQAKGGVVEITLCAHEALTRSVPSPTESEVTVPPTQTEQHEQPHSANPLQSPPGQRVAQ